MRALKALSIFSLFLFLHISSFIHATVLSTNSRWIVYSDTGYRAKLVCASWASHVEPMIAEGLDKKPLIYIVWQISRAGLNCVRFTWPTFMFTRPDFYDITVSDSLDKYNLGVAKEGFQRNNPWALDLKVQQLHRSVVDFLGWFNIMVILDNHISRPTWCCGANDKNTFFGDDDFQPEEWLQGLSNVASAYADSDAVVGMSLRNELRGDLENEDDWYTYMQEGATTVNQQNPELLVIVSGLNYDSDLSFLYDQPFSVNFTNKVVFEFHLYGFFIPKQLWLGQTNKFCFDMTQTMRDNNLFLTTLDEPYPIFLSEFGLDQRGKNEGELRYLTCLMAEMAGQDLDWGLWALQGSYMYRQKKTYWNETYGLLDAQWDGVRNASLWNKFQLLKQTNIEVAPSFPTLYIMFHPQSGLCVNMGFRMVYLGNCRIASRWNKFQNGGPITLAQPRYRSRSPLCINVIGNGSRIILSSNCSTNWKVASSMGLQLATQVGPGQNLCMGTPNVFNASLVTTDCLCVDNKLHDLSTCVNFNPQVQWFKFVPVNT